MGERGLVDFFLCRITNLSSREKVLLAQHCKNEADFIALSRIDVELLIGHVLRGAAWDKDALLRQAEADATAARQRGISWVSYQDTRYPPLLREAWDPPVVLFYRGVMPNPEQPLLAIVGTREPSEAGRREAYTLAKDVARAGIAVISGLALGIDAMAHRGNIEGGAPTVAVLGSGLDKVYPASNRPLARRIVEQGGALLSEYPPGSSPERWHFPARNRIISTLARGTLIIEAPERSGALITARFALEQGRDLWVSARGVASPHGEGVRKLHDDGAPCVNSARDILADWGLAGSNSETSKPARMFTPSSLAASLAASLNLPAEE
ncbi:MAG: DNA-processing protein DprA [Treponema sp.]|jgi:DNA processing protein|nr:DNA-processing protein DprA [Treponema sp.]